MKKALALIAAAGLMAAATTAMAAPVSIVNSKHNVSASGPGSVVGSGTQICIYCHTPHRAQSMSTLFIPELRSSFRTT